MSPQDPEKYRPMIDAILSVADLEEITVKRIRNALQELFAVDLLPQKKEMNNFILQRYYKLLDERDNPKPTHNSDEENGADKEREYQDHLLAQKLSRSENNRPITRRGAAPPRVTKRKTTTRKVSRTPNTAFNQELVLSPQLSAVVNAEKLSRPQVVKQMWAYIKANNLQDPSDKRKIHCDEKLRNVFKKSSVGMFEMNKILGDHFYKEGEIVNGHTKKEEVYSDEDDDEPAHSPPKLDTKPARSLKQEVVSDSSEISDVDD